MAPFIGITGGNGNLAQKLAHHLFQAGYSVKLFDISHTCDPPIYKGSDPAPIWERITCDLRSPGKKWYSEAFGGLDVVVHFAAQRPHPDATWVDAKASMDINSNVAVACATSGVKRLVFASSNHVMGGHKEEGLALDGELPGGPLTGQTRPLVGSKFDINGVKMDSTPYASAKLQGESIGESFARQGAFEFVAVRIGWCQDGVNDPKTISLGFREIPLSILDTKNDSKCTLTNPHLPHKWFRLMWLSNQDCCNLFERACVAELPDGDNDGKFFITVNGMSENSEMRWCLKSAKEVLGYAPADDISRHVSM